MRLGRRRPQRPTFLAKVLRIIAVVRLLVRAWRVYRRGRRAIRVVAVAFLTGAAAMVLRRLRNRQGEPELAYSPPPTPTVPPGPPPLDAGSERASEADPA